LRLETSRESQTRRLIIKKGFDEGLGLEVEPFRVRTCRNNCVFCFVRQGGKGLRPSLCVRDDDYRMSFLHGAYITGTNLTGADLARIEEQRLAPLYLSVHTTDPRLRGAMLGCKGREPEAPTRPLMDFLAQRRLAFHAQIVVCPGINGGAELRKTLEDLCGYYPACRSIAVVPVGLTSHREGLPRLRPVTPDYARYQIRKSAPLRERLARRLGEDIIYLSDEFYLLAGLPLPDYSRREYWHQLENGVGMVYEFYKGFRPSKLPRRVETPRRVALVTSRLGKMVLARLIGALNAIEGLRADAVVARNALFGKTATVTGLLSGADVARAIWHTLRCYDRFLIPANCLRADNVFLDDMTLDELRKETNAPVLVAGNANEAAQLCLMEE